LIHSHIYIYMKGEMFLELYVQIQHLCFVAGLSSLQIRYHHYIAVGSGIANCGEYCGVESGGGGHICWLGGVDVLHW